MNWTTRCCNLLVFAGLAWPLLACDPLELSDEGQYELDIGLVNRLVVDSRRVLVGSEFNATIEGLTGDPELDPKGGGLQCPTKTASGSLTQTNTHTFVVTSTGAGAIEIAPPDPSCPANDPILAELEPDRWSMIGVDASAGTGVWMPEADAAVLARRATPGGLRLFPSGFGRPLLDLPVVAGSSFSARPTLIDASVGERAEIRWNRDDAVLNVPGHFEALASYTTEAGEREPQTYLAGSLRAGESFHSSITILEHDYAMPKVRAVPAEHIAAIELVSVYDDDDHPERDWGPPIAVVTITRDAEGTRILGAPIEWSVTRGRLITDTETFTPGALAVGDCKRAPKRAEWRSATVEASLGDLVASADFDWIAVPGDVTDPSNPNCSGSACDCSTTERPGGSGVALVGLFGLGAWLRRRPKATSTRP